MVTIVHTDHDKFQVFGFLVIAKQHGLFYIALKLICQLSRSLPAMNNMSADDYVQGTVDNDLGVVPDDSCWLWADGTTGLYKLVMRVDPLMSSPTDVVLLADQIYNNCLGLDFVKSKLYL